MFIKDQVQKVIYCIEECGFIWVDQIYGANDDLIGLKFETDDMIDISGREKRLYYMLRLFNIKAVIIRSLEATAKYDYTSVWRVYTPDALITTDFFGSIIQRIAMPTDKQMTAEEYSKIFKCNCVCGLEAK